MNISKLELKHIRKVLGGASYNLLTKYRYMKKALIFIFFIFQIQLVKSNLIYILDKTIGMVEEVNNKICNNEIEFHNSLDTVIYSSKWDSLYMKLTYKKNKISYKIVRYGSIYLEGIISGKKFKFYLGDKTVFNLIEGKLVSSHHRKIKKVRIKYPQGYDEITKAKLSFRPKKKKYKVTVWNTDGEKKIAIMENNEFVELYESLLVLGCVTSK